MTATLLAGLLNRQHMSALSMSPLQTGQGPGTGRSAWRRALWRRRTEAFELYCSTLDTDPAHAAAANGLAVMVLDPAHTENFVYYDDDAPDDDAEDLGEPDPEWRTEAERRLRNVLAEHPDDTVTAENLARILALRGVAPGAPAARVPARHRYRAGHPPDGGRAMARAARRTPRPVPHLRPPARAGRRRLRERRGP